MYRGKMKVGMDGKMQYVTESWGGGGLGMRPCIRATPKS